jgi:hypothetical protein
MRVRFLVLLFTQVMLVSVVAATPLFQEVEIPVSNEGVVIRPTEGGIVTIGSASTSVLLSNLKFLPGQFPPPLPSNIKSYVVGNVTFNTVDLPPTPPAEPPPLPPPPPVLPTAWITSGNIVELGSGIIPAHISNKGHAAVGTFNSIGDSSVQGDITLEEGGYLYFDASGKGQGEYDLIRAYRSLAISGTIRMIFRNGYAPRGGDVVPLVQFSQSVTFTNISAHNFEFANLKSSPHIGIWINDNIFGIRFYSDTTFVPEPSVMLLMMCGTLFCATQRCWR